jgi:hypothetical protein
MPLRKILGLICLILTALCLGFGIASVRQWIAFTAGLIALLIWLLAYKWPSFWLSSTALGLSVSLAAGGLLLSASPFLMLLAVTLALANWDLAFWNDAPADGSSTRAVSLLEQKHYQSLALVLGLTLLLTVAGRMIRFQIPFVGMLLLVILTFLSLSRLGRMLSD